MTKLLALVAVLVCLVGCSGGAPEGSDPPDSPIALPEGYTDKPEHSARTECRDKSTASVDPALGEQSDGRPDGPTIARIRKEGLVIGVSQTASLFSKRDLVTGELAGFEIDLADRIAAALFPHPEPGKPGLRLLGLPTGGRLGSLDTEQNAAEKARNTSLKEVPRTDLVIADVSVTCGRVETYGLRYSTPYLTTNSGLLVRKGMGTVSGPDDLGGRKVCSATRTTNSDEMIDARDRQRQSGLRELVPVAVADNSDCLMLLQRGLVDAIYTDVLILQGFHDQDPGTVLLDYHNAAPGEVAIAMSGKQDDLVRFVNSVLRDMRRDGSLQRSYDTWFRGVPQNHRAPLPAEPFPG
ncbi:transporter substrate-binding domain-containing protein [Actinosynnema sp. NPDC020468]|uniref:transporter substrate-binding domain-containing protein n=1 Tax=Actinosynnema sp. NPDC020468 TaxID=3154488 RepID=UPI0033CBC33C